VSERSPPTPREPAATELPHPLTEFFDPIRRWRSERYASYQPGAAPAKRRAALTMVHDEPVFLPIWLDYHRRFFGPEDIYVLDNDSTDGSAGGEGFVRIPVAHDRVDHKWMVDTISAKQRELLGDYDVVVVTDVDEVIAPDPAWGTLGDYLDRFDEEWVNCIGYEVLHLPDREPPLDLDSPLLAQRRFWFANDAYDKAAIASVPVDWKTGFHGREDERWNLDPDLRLIHLHRIDFEICRERHRTRRLRRWNEADLDASWAAHNLLTEGEEFERWFFESSSSYGIDVNLEPIPAPWRTVL
jgi:glycosyl transferase family 2